MGPYYELLALLEHRTQSDYMIKESFKAKNYRKEIGEVMDNDTCDYFNK